MNLEAKIMDRLKQAMKDKNEVALRTLRAIKAAILVEKTSEGHTGELTEAEEVKLLQKMAKQRKESLDIFLKQDRHDLAKKEEEELAILDDFLPRAMNPEELAQAVSDAIRSVGANGPQDIGKVMGAANKTIAGRADGKLVAEEVKKQLSSL